MNIFYFMSTNGEGLSKYASDFTNDAETLTGLFYGMLKEAARTNSGGKGKPGRNINKHISFDTPEAQAKAEASSAEAAAKSAAKKQRNIENSFHFPKNDTSPAHLKEQARIKQTFRFADPEYNNKVRDRLARIQGALLGKRDETIRSLEDYEKFQNGQIDSYRRSLGRLSEKSAADLAALKAKSLEDLASFQSKYNTQAAELKGVRDALKSANTQRELDKSLIRAGKDDLRRVQSLANNRQKEIKNLAKSLKRSRLGMVATGLGGLAAGAGGLALYNNYQNKTASADSILNRIDLSNPELQRTIGYTGGGAALGGLVGALSSKENRTRNALIGALLGGAGGYAFDKYGHKPVADIIKARRSAR